MLSYIPLSCLSLNIARFYKINHFCVRIVFWPLIAEHSSYIKFTCIGHCKNRPATIVQEISGHSIRVVFSLKIRINRKKWMNLSTFSTIFVKVLIVIVGTAALKPEQRRFSNTVCYWWSSSDNVDVPLLQVTFFSCMSICIGALKGQTLNLTIKT